MNQTEWEASPHLETSVASTNNQCFKEIAGPLILKTSSNASKIEINAAIEFTNEAFFERISIYPNQGCIDL